TNCARCPVVVVYDPPTCTTGQRTIDTMPPHMSQSLPQSKKVDFFGLTPRAFDETVAEWGWPRFRAAQVRDWVYRKNTLDPQQMTNLGKAGRALLADRVSFATASETIRQLSADGTIKL